jgi:hypothetical protein
LYDLNNDSLKSDYSIKISDLRRLKPLIERDLFGDLVVDGKIIKQKDSLIVDGFSKKFDGRVDFNLKNDDFKANASDLRLLKITEMLGYDKYADGVINSDFIYNLKTKKGKADLVMSEGKLLRSKLTDLIDTFSSVKITKERYNKTTANAIINDNIINFKLFADGKRSTIEVKDGVLNTKNDAISAKILLNIEKKDFAIKLSGTTKSPKFKLDASKYIKSKAVNEVDKLLDKNIKDKGLKKEIGNLLKMF